VSNYKSDQNLSGVNVNFFPLSVTLRPSKLEHLSLETLTSLPSSVTLRPSKLEHLSLETLTSQVLEFEGKAKANPIGVPFRCFLLG
jgi:hypothetical protein